MFHYLHIFPGEIVVIVLFYYYTGDLKFVLIDHNSVNFSDCMTNICVCEVYWKG